MTIVVEPVTAVADAVHVTWASSPSAGKGPNPPGDRGSGGLRRTMSAELVTDPPAGVPTVLAVSGPDGGADATPEGQMPPKKTAGPNWPFAPSGSVWVIAVAEPPTGSVTDGLKLGSVEATPEPHPARFWGPPPRPTLT